jgi:hypothetical protein
MAAAVLRHSSSGMLSVVQAAVVVGDRQQQQGLRNSPSSSCSLSSTCLVPAAADGLRQQQAYSKACGSSGARASLQVVRVTPLHTCVHYAVLQQQRTCSIVPGLRAVVGTAEGAQALV